MINLFIYIIYGSPATISFSIPHSFIPLLILKRPESPQDVPQLFTTSQYGIPLSLPQPIIFTACPPKKVAVDVRE